MLKGKTKVELFDAETGKLVKSVEKHNEITSAYQKLINFIFFTGNTNDNIYLTDAFGGIIMFDSDIPDGAIIQDKTNHCTGIAFYNNIENGADKLGSYNTKESSIDYGKKTATFVYDFTTSQANGVVKSICLCSKSILALNGIQSGKISGNLNLQGKYDFNYYRDTNCFVYGDDYSYDSMLKGLDYPVNNISNKYYYNFNYDVFFDFDNFVRYQVCFTSKKKFYAKKTYMPHAKWSAFADKSYNSWKGRHNHVKEESIEVDLSGIYGGFRNGTYNSHNYISTQISGYKGVAYMMLTSGSTQAGGTDLSILKYDFNRFGIEGNEASIFNVLIPAGYSLQGNYNAGFYVDSEYVYYVVTNGTDYFVAKSSMTNNADSKILSKIDLYNGSFYASNCKWLPGTLRYRSGNYYSYYNFDNGEKSYSKDVSGNYDNAVFDFKDEYIYYPYPNYYHLSYYDYTLKSINNLTDAITKTNSNTMKITYTLTETDS